MGGDTKVILWTVIVVAAVAFLIVQMWPRRRRHELQFTRRIAAPAERVWDAYVSEPDNPVSAEFHASVLSVRTISTEPKIVEIVGSFDSGYGHRQHVVQAESLIERRPEFSSIRYNDVDGHPFPFGEEHREEFRLTQEPEAVIATVTWRGELATLGQRWAVSRRLKQYMDSLKSFSETGEGTAIPKPQRSPWRSLGLTVLALGSFTYLLGWAIALILSLAIVIHEFGHWLAMRMTGQPKPRIVLIPFFGGAAVPNHPYKTQFDRAFVALAGAGFSLLPCLILLLCATALGVDDAPGSGSKLAVLFTTGRGLLAVALLFGFLNALQLLPVMPLDGGHVVRSVVESTGSRRARPVMLGLTIAGMAAFGVMGDYILAAILALGAMQAWHIGADGQHVARPMGPAGSVTIGVSYVLVFAIHAGIAVHGLRTLGLYFQ